MSRTIECFPSGEAWVEGATEEIIGRLRAALATRRRATVLLAGGSTPEPVYRALARAERIPWESVHWFWGDERHVPPDDPQSNFGMAREALLAPLGLGASSPTVHRFPTETTPEADATRYERTLRDFFGLGAAGVPTFDLVLLGMGDDGHTASLFPGTEALDETARLAVANPVPHLDGTRLTVTFPLLNAARCVVALVTGAAKAPVLVDVLDAQRGDAPILRVQPSGDMVWLLDRAAASLLPDGVCE